MKQPDKKKLTEKLWLNETNRLKSLWSFKDKATREKYPLFADLVKDREAILKQQLADLDKVEEVKEQEKPVVITQPRGSELSQSSDTIPSDILEYFNKNGVILPSFKAVLKPFQWKETVKLWEDTMYNGLHCIALQSAVGTGKTWMLGAFLRLLKENKYFEGKTFAPWPMLWVTKASVVPQTIRVCEHQFGLKQMDDILITNYDQLRSSFGEQLLENYYVVINGEEHLKFKWKRFLYPLVVVWDECHSLKNENSQQSKIGQAFNEITDPNLIQIHMSATMWTRIADMRCFACGTKSDINELLKRL